MRACVRVGTFGTVVAVVAAAGCFDPHIPTGAPCDPSTPACPHDQVCVAGPRGFTCELPGGADAELGSGPDAPPGTPDARAVVTPDGPVVTSPDGPPALHVEYVATVAECVDPLDPSPSVCKAINGDDQLVVDHRDTGTADPWNAYVRFNLDAAIAGHTVTQVVLRLTATDDPKAPGSTAGTVYVVEAFTALSLEGTTPADLGAPIAMSPGPVDLGAQLDWSLPIATVTAGAPVYLGISSASDDGVNYWNLAGPEPPRLIIDAQ